MIRPMRTFPCRLLSFLPFLINPKDFKKQTDTNFHLIQEIQSLQGSEKTKKQEELQRKQKDDLSSIEIIKTIQFLDKEGKKQAQDTLRAAYREVSAYSIHYSNIRAAMWPPLFFQVRSPFCFLRFGTTPYQPNHLSVQF